MNIGSLLKGSYTVQSVNQAKHRTANRYPSATFVHKEFGQIYGFNKNIKYKSDSDIIEFQLMMGVATQVDRSTHKISVAIKGVKIKEYTAEELADKIRGANKKYTQLKKLDNKTVVTRAIKNDKLYRGFTIFNKSNTNDILSKNGSILDKNNENDKFVIVDKVIPLTAETRVTCSCSDFFYTFSYYNYEHGCLLGPKPPPYKKYTGSDSIVIKRNIRETPGVCKHLMLFFAMLMDGKTLFSGKIIENESELMSGYKANSLVKEQFSKKNYEFLTRGDIVRLMNDLSRQLEEFNKEVS
jgi:hypothetical protein